MRVTLVVGARPNFMKVAPVLKALTGRPGVVARLVHTGQHYDEKMSDSFLRDLSIPPPDTNLGVGSGSHARQTAEVLTGFEQELLGHPADFVLVAGDVNSTVAAALAAVKLGIKVGHIESGLRSRDWNMPEEINRILTDTISSFLFVTEQSGLDNLAAEGVAADRVHHVGNSMIDTLLAMKDQALGRPVPRGLPDRYSVVTLHRPSNVDDADSLGGILGALEDVAADLPMVWPIHPRTEKRLREFGLWERVERCPSFRLLPPIGYLDFMALTARATLVLTDSGGIQEEALVLKVPVVTMRENTERPVTIDCGGNLLAGSDPERIRLAAVEMLARNRDDFQIPPLWDGRTGERIADVLVEAAP